jgi:hypothetical protein
MRELISRNINDSEIFIRFVFHGNFKNSNKGYTISNIADQKIYFDSRGGVSMQRERYCSESESKSFAKKIQLKYIGFVIFKKECFDEILKELKDVWNDFEAIIKSTPLDEGYNVIDEGIEVYTDTPINPGHADLYYENPAIKEDENTHSFARVFSKNLFKKSTLIVDLLEQEDHLSHCFINDNESERCIFKEVV